MMCEPAPKPLRGRSICMMRRVALKAPRHLSIVAAVVAAFAGSQAATAGGLALIGGTLIDGTGRPPIKHSVVVIEDGTIHSIGTLGAVRIPAHFRRIDTTHKAVLPGLINVHVHFGSAGHNDYARWDRE